MKHVKLYEHKYYIDSLINWDLINDTKDMALEYIDEGYTLYLYVAACEKYNSSNRFIILNLEFDHSIFTVNKDYTYRTELNIKRIKNIEITYLIIIINNMYDHKYQNELINRVRIAYPNENIIRG